LGFVARRRLHDQHPGRSALATLALGVLIYGPLYGLIFEALGTATLAGGAAIGAIHGSARTLAAIARQRRAPHTRRAEPAAVHGRRIVARLVYGAVVGFLYVVPPA